MSSEEKSPGFEPAIVPTLRPGKAGGVRAKNRQERTEALCRAGLRLFRERGLAQATVDEITREAGVSKGSFYRYFTDKAALVAAIFAPLEQQMDEAMERCRQAIHAADDDEALRAAYGVLAQTLAVMIFGSAEVVELYLRAQPSTG